MRIRTARSFFPFFVLLSVTAFQTVRAAVGTVAAWGAGTHDYEIFPDYGQCIIPAGLTNVVALAGGGAHSLALTSDGRLIGWGGNYSGQISIPPGLSNLTAIAAGWSHSLVLSGDGTVTAWGDNVFGQTNVPSGLSNVIAIARGDEHNLALTADRNVVAWGAGTVDTETYPDFGQSIISPSLTNIAAVSGGGLHSLALNADGTVAAWGRLLEGQIFVPNGLGDVVAIAAGGVHSIALKGDGTVVGWGQISVPAGLSNVVAIAAGEYHCLALQEDGTVVGFGGNTDGQTAVPSGLTNVVAIAAGGRHSLVLMNDGSPVIALPPGSQSLWSGRTGSLQVKALGAPPLIYQWRRNGTEIPGATDPMLTITNLQTSDSGTYEVSVSNVVGVIRTNAVLLVSDAAPQIRTQPASQSVSVGLNAAFSVDVGGSWPVTYQWTHEGTNFPGATDSSLTISDVQPEHEGNWTVAVTNSFGSALSSNAFLNVIDLGEALNATNLVWSTGGTARWFAETFTTMDGQAALQSGALADPSQPVQSYVETTVPGPGAVSFWWTANISTYEYVNLQMDGVEQLRVSSSVGWQQQTVYFGPGPHTLRWSYVKTGFGTGGAWLDEVTYTPGGIAALFVSSPTNKLVSAGGNTSFAAQAGGTPPLAWQWQFNGADIPSATNTSLVISNVQSWLAGAYTAVVSNDYGSSTSAVATLTVAPSIPTLLLRPTNQIMLPGQTITFAVIAKGSEPFSYQWRVNGTNVSFGTAASLVLNDQLAVDGGSYTVVVSNQYASVTSSPPAFLIKTVPLPVLTAAGYPRLSGTTDGAGTNSRFAGPWDITFDSAGVGYVADRNNNTIRKLFPTPTNWIVSTIAGAQLTGTADGTNTTIRFYNPSSIAVDAATNLYIADTYNYTIRKLTPVGTNWVSSTLAGSPRLAGSADGTNAIARFNLPTGITVDSATNLYVVDWGNHTIRKVSPVGTNWVVTTIAGSAGHGGFVDATGAVARLYYPEHIILGPSGNLFVADAGNNSVRKLAPLDTNWIVTTLAGGKLGFADGVGTNAMFNSAKGLALASDSNLYVADTLNNALRRITPAGVVSTCAGASTVGFADGVGSQARFSQPAGMAMDPLGRLLIADSVNNTIRLATPAIPPLILTQPKDQSALFGSNAGFSVSVSGSAPLSFQWRHAGVSLPAGTSSTLNLDNLQYVDAGTYDLLVTNLYGTALSQTATLTVLRPSPRFNISAGQLGLTGAGFMLQVTDLSGHGAVVFYASTNLVDWLPIATNPPSIGSVQFTDPDATNLPTRFYRAEEQ